MEHSGTEKTERNNKIIEYRKAKPELSLEKIGLEFNISRQRVHQILKKELVASRHGRIPPW